MPMDPLRAQMAAWVADGALHGGVLAVAIADDPVRTIAFGEVAVAGTTEPARTDHRFLLTSITKALTAIQILQVVERTDLELTTPLSRVVPPFGRHGKDRVLLVHALTHTSGIDEPPCNTAEGPASRMGPADHLAAVNDARLAVAPGVRVAYCSPIFWVLAEVIAAVTGTNHADHLTASVAGPLGMVDTAYEPGAERPPRYVDAVVSPPQAHLPEQVRRLAYPAGGVVSTAPDLVRLGRVLLRGGRDADGTSLVSPVMLQQMWRPRTVGLPGARDYEGGRLDTERGLGWALGGPGRLRSPRTLWHSGGSGTSMWVDPDRQAVVVLLTATWFLDRTLLGAVIDLALDAPPVSASLRHR